MNHDDPQQVGSFVEFLRRPEGICVVMKPGASRIPFEKILAFTLSQNIPGVDMVRLRAAWSRADANPVIVAPPSQTAASLDDVLQTQDSDGEIFLVVAPSAATLTPDEVVGWLNKRHFSGLDLKLIKEAVEAPRGAPHVITRLRSPDESPATATRCSVPDATILLAAANDRALAVAALVLSQRGFGVRRAVGSEAAVFEATQHLPDVVIVDTSLNNETALGTCRQLAVDRRTTSIPVFVSCSEATVDFVRQALEAGARDLIVHPVSAQVLTRKLTKVFETAGKTLPSQAAPKTDQQPGPGTLGKVDLATLFKNVAKLHAIPAVVERVVRISGDEQAGAQELAQAVGMDQAATTLVLQVANSVAYGAARRISNLAEALTRIGFRQTRSLVVGKGMMQAFEKKTESVGFDRMGCWRHALAAALVARRIAEHTRQVSTDLAFIAGLVHDVGKVLLDQFCPGDFEEAVHRAIHKRMPLKDAEKEILRTSHVEVAAHALRSWNFPDDIIDAVKHHHELIPDGAGYTAERLKLFRVVYVANALAKATGIGRGGGDTFIAEIRDGVWCDLDLGRGLPQTFWKMFGEDFRQCHSFLGIPYEERPSFSADRGTGLLHDEDSSPVSLLRVALESAGWKVERPPTSALPPTGPQQVERPAFLILRCRSTESLTASVKQWEAVAREAPTIGILPSGARKTPGMEACFVEPYDREELVNLLSHPSGDAPPES